MRGINCVISTALIRGSVHTLCFYFYTSAVGSQDYVTIYDGYDTRDPIILKFCGGGQQLPPVFASGAELLVEFTTSPFGTFLTAPPNINGLSGFQFEVSVGPTE